MVWSRHGSSHLKLLDCAAFWFASIRDFTLCDIVQSLQVGITSSMSGCSLGIYLRLNYYEYKVTWEQLLQVASIRQNRINVQLKMLPATGMLGALFT